MTDTVKPKKDSIPFPDFRLPADIEVRAQRVQVSDTGGLMVECEGVDIETTGPQSVRLSIRDVRARQTGIAQAIPGRGARPGTIPWRLRCRRRGGGKGDSVHVSALLPKANLLRATAELKAWLASSDPYMEAFKLPATLPRVEGLAASFKVSMPGSFRVEADIKARVSRFPDSLPLKLGPQNVAIRFGFADTAGTWSITSRGLGGREGGGSEDVDLQGNLYVTGRDSLANPAWLASHAGTTAKGHLRGFAVTAAGKRGTADLRIAEARASGDAIKADITTGDGSRIAADLRKIPANGQALASVKPGVARVGKTRVSSPKSGKKAPAPSEVKSPSALADWNGTFSVNLAPGERWLVAFTDTNLAFTSAQRGGNPPRRRGHGDRRHDRAQGLRRFGRFRAFA